MYLNVSKVPRYVCILRTEDYRGYFLFRGGLFPRARNGIRKKKGKKKKKEAAYPNMARMHGKGAITAMA